MTSNGRLRHPRALVLLSAFVAAYVVLFVVVDYVTVRTVPGRVLADASLRGALSVSGTGQRTVDAVLNVVSVASLLGAVAVVATIALLRLARIPGLAAIGLLVGANLTTWVLKSLLSRPDVGLSEVSPSTLNSLPSGHSTAVFSAVAALVFVLPHRWRLATALVGGGYATLTGLATMAAGWHRAGDSIAAFLVVGVWTVLAAILVVVTGTASGRDAGRYFSSAMRWLVAAMVGSLVVGLTLAVGLYAADGLRESTLGSWAAFFVGSLLIVAAVAGTLVGIVTTLSVMESTEPGDVQSG